MFTFKNVVAVGLFLFGTTFLWMTRAFLADARAGTGAVWSVIQVLAFVTIIGFSAAAWLVFKEMPSWEPVAIASAVVGVLTVLAYIVGIRQVGEAADEGMEINIAIHVLGLAAVFLIVLLPVAHEWLTKRI
jgi:hypothetical protein